MGAPTSPSRCFVFNVIDLLDRLQNKLSRQEYAHRGPNHNMNMSLVCYGIVWYLIVWYNIVQYGIT